MKIGRYIISFLFALIFSSYLFAINDVLGLLNQPQLQALHDNGDFELLNVQCDKILSNPENQEQKGIALLYKSLSENAVGNYDEAELFLDQAALIFQKSKRKDLIEVVKLKKAMIYFGKGENDLAKVVLNSIEENIDPSKEAEILLEVKDLQSMVLASENQHHESIRKLKEIVSILEINSSEPSMKTAAVIDQIASNYFSIGEVDSAIYHYQKLLTIPDILDSNAELNTLSTLSDLYLKKGNHKKAQGLLIKAIKIAEEENDIIFLQNLNTQITGLFIQQKQWDSAGEYCDSALEILAKEENIYLEATNLRYKGIILFNQDQIEKAEVFLQRSLDQFSKISNFGDAASVAGMMADMDLNPPEVSHLKPHIENLIRIHENTGDEIGMIKNKFVLAQLLYLEGKNQTSIELLNDILSIAQQNNNLPAAEKAHLMLSKVYPKVGRHDIALNHVRQYHEIYDQLRLDNVNETINRLNVEYETQKTQQELEKEKILTSKQTEEIRRKNLQNLLLIIGILVAFLLATGYYSINRKNKLLQKQKITVMEKEKEADVLKAVLKGEETERSRVARELHDGLGAVLATVKMQINGIQNTYPEVTELSAYQTAESLIDDACDSVRSISHDMMPSIIHDQGLEHATAKLCNLISSKETLHIDFIPFQLELVKDKEIQFQVYRIVQELLKNIIKHANASEVIVQITNEDETLDITVEDDGKGFDVAAVKEGIGLENIKFRVEHLKGSLDIASTINEGSTFNVQIPLKNG